MPDCSARVVLTGSDMSTFCQGTSYFCSIGQQKSRETARDEWSNELPPLMPWIVQDYSTHSAGFHQALLTCWEVVTCRSTQTVLFWWAMFVAA